MTHNLFYNNNFNTKYMLFTIMCVAMLFLCITSITSAEDLSLVIAETRNYMGNLNISSLHDALTINATDTVATDGPASQVVKVLCMVYTAINGPVGKVIAAILIGTMAISLFLGKLQWGTAIATAVAISLLFGAEPIVKAVSAGSIDCT